MPFTFTMTLSGLMVVVPSRPFLFAPVDSMSILIPNLRRPRQLDHLPTEVPPILDPHFAFLEFPKDARLAESTRQTDLSSPVRGADLCHLVGEEIEIQVPGLEPVFTMNTLHPADLEEPTAEEERSLFWMATMEQASSGKGLLKPELLTTSLENTGPLGVRLRFNTGHFCTARLSDRNCRFVPQQRGEVERRYAIRLALEIANVPDRVKILLKKGEVTQELHLAPQGAQDSLKVQLSNREFEDILKPDPQEVTLLPTDRPLADFQVFYDFSRDFMVGDAKRFLQQVSNGDRDGETFPPHALCPPTGMAIAA